MFFIDIVDLGFSYRASAISLNSRRTPGVITPMILHQFPSTYIGYFPTSCLPEEKKVQDEKEDDFDAEL